MNAYVAAFFGAAALTLLATTASAEATGPVSPYDKLLVDEVELSYDAASPLKSLTDAEANRIIDSARAALTSAAARRFTIVAKPGPGVIRLHATIAGIDAAKRDKHFWRFTPVGLIKTRVDAASGADIIVRSATVDVVAFDALTGERLSMSSTAPRGDGSSAPSVATSLRELAVALDAKARRLFAEIAPQARDDAGVDGAASVDETLVLH